MNYHKIEKTSIANGEGIRVVLWVSGCSLHCRGCQNPQSWSFNSGKPFDAMAKKELFEALDKDYIQGITFSGGHPLEDANVKEIYELMVEVKERFPEKDIWLYTGYTWDYIFHRAITDNFDFERDQIIDYQKKIVSMCNVVVDGKYIEELRNLTLKWRGSSNQRVIDVQKSLTKGEVMLWE